MKLIDEKSTDGVCEPIFDLCFLDGAHNFEIDCCAFFLVDKLLKPGGFIVFDDLNWSYSQSKNLKNTDFVKEMAEDERSIPHIKKLVELIVISHPHFGDFEAIGDWFLTKKLTDEYGAKSSKADFKKYQMQTSVYHDAKQLIKKIVKRS